jgi:hypothetical protein
MYVSDNMTAEKIHKKTLQYEMNVLIFVYLKIFYFFFVDELLAEKEKYKGVSEELDMTLNELSGY